MAGGGGPAALRRRPCGGDGHSSAAAPWLSRHRRLQASAQARSSHQTATNSATIKAMRRHMCGLPPAARTSPSRRAVAPAMSEPVRSKSVLMPLSSALSVCTSSWIDCVAALSAPALASSSAMSLCEGARRVWKTRGGWRAAHSYAHTRVAQPTLSSRTGHYRSPAHPALPRHRRSRLTEAGPAQGSANGCVREREGK